MKHSKASTSVKKAIGHLNKVLEMIKKEQYCIDILQQVSAAKGHLKSAQGSLLDGHLNSCAVKAFSSKDPKDKEKVVEEIINLFNFS